MCVFESGVERDQSSTVLDDLLRSCYNSCLIFSILYDPAQFDFDSEAIKTTAIPTQNEALSVRVS